MLSDHPRLDQRPCQPKAGVLVGERAVLADPTLNLTGRRDQAGSVMAGGGHPVDADAVLDTPA
jgi:hypothetical protein